MAKLFELGGISFDENESLSGIPMTRWSDDDDEEKEERGGGNFAIKKIQIVVLITVRIDHILRASPCKIAKRILEEYILNEKYYIYNDLNKYKIFFL